MGNDPTAKGILNTTVLKSTQCSVADSQIPPKGIQKILFEINTHGR